MRPRELRVNDRGGSLRECKIWEEGRPRELGVEQIVECGRAT